MAGTNKQREEINRKLVSMQMEKIGLTYEDAMNTPEFWRVYTLTTEQSEEWRKEATKLIQKTFKCNKKAAETTRAWFELNLGLRIDDTPVETTYIHTTIMPEDVHILKQQEYTPWQKLKRTVKMFFTGSYD
jgi:hypothetical protein